MKEHHGVTLYMHIGKQRNKFTNDKTKINWRFRGEDHRCSRKISLFYLLKNLYILNTCKKFGDQNDPFEVCRVWGGLKSPWFNYDIYLCLPNSFDSCLWKYIWCVPCIQFNFWKQNVPCIKCSYFPLEHVKKWSEQLLFFKNK